MTDSPELPHVASGSATLKRWAEAGANRIGYDAPRRPDGAGPIASLWESG
jgi:hypothetical protein